MFTFKNSVLKKILLLSSVLVLTIPFLSCGNNKSSSKKEVTVYAYDSFAGEWGAAPAIKEKFETATGYTLNIIDCGDAVQAYTKALAEKDSPHADVILGIDNNMLAKVRTDGLLEKYEPKGLDQLNPDLQRELGGDWLLTPFDYSHFAIIYDSNSGVKKPESLRDLTLPEYKQSIILMNPRTSTPGLGFLSWTVSVFGSGEELTSYWTALKPNILTMTNGWSEGWGMFENGEAPLVISYTTSPAYNVEYDDNWRDQALIFNEGHVQQVEGLGLIKNAPNKKGGQAFIDFMISEEAQKELLFTQWMYPSNTKVALPESYVKAAPVPSLTLPTYSEATDAVMDEVMNILGK